MSNVGHIFIVGGQRSGTTYLSNLLEQNSRILFTKIRRPEPKAFFDENLSIDSYREQYFDKYCSETKYLAEKATSYHEDRDSLLRIRELEVNRRIYFIVRNPIDRAISNYRFSVQNGYEKRSLREVFLDNVASPDPPSGVSVSPFDYINRSFVHGKLVELEELFGDEFVPLSFADLVMSPHEVVRGIEENLGIDHQPLNLEVDSNDTRVSAEEPHLREVVQLLSRIYDDELVNLNNYGIRI
jgi:hypothetical protein